MPGKNIRFLGGKPLINWSIEAAQAAPEICDIMVSTDSPGIAEIAEQAGAKVPWLRPADLASDQTTSIDVCVHAVDWYENNVQPVDGLLLLQPTSPFRGSTTIADAITLFKKHGRRPVVALSPARTHPMWCFRVSENRMTSFMEGDAMSVRSQDLPPAYAPNGSLYLLSPNHLRTRRSFYHDDVIPLIIEAPEASIDIDTEWDWQLAESHQQLTAPQGKP